MTMQTGTASTTSLALLLVGWSAGCTARDTGSGGAGGTGTGTATSETTESGDSSSTGPEGTCLELAEFPAPMDFSDAYWVCAWACGPLRHGELVGERIIMARESYAELTPGQPDMCYELRTDFYNCFGDLTCPEVWAFSAAVDAGIDGPCTAEYNLLGPMIETCGI